ncbi:phage major capsid protein [Parvularcula sp. LCG005]|uniref:phage major capsid protein n=1 Tax=Parvularcula sp. LCG005 TaxID=3078805 RepID=UPI0029430AC2|nr:phage major capsid protein [Parvularcula sp. LCG005]WOI53992.1 phage major capsid protein [Parvularcula sp. LCG005]
MSLETKAQSDAPMKSAMHDLLYTFEQFKDANDQRLAEIEKRGHEDGLLTEKVDRLNSVVAEQKAAIERMSVLNARPAREGTALVAPTEAKQAFDGYMRSGLMAAPSIKSIAASDTDGAVIAPVETAQMIDSGLMAISPIRQIATVRQISGHTYRKPYQPGQFAAGWAGETASRPETATPSLQALDFPAMELYAMPATTQALLEDSIVDVSQWIADEVQVAFAEQETTAFITGNGTSRPRGFLDYTTADDSVRDSDELGTVSSSGASISGDDLINLIYTLPQAYRANGRFVMNRGTAAAVRKLKDADGNYLWSPGISAGQPSTLLGYAVTEAEDMSDVANAATPIAFGDFARGYLIVDRAGIQVLRDPFSAKPYVLFCTTKRVGGGVQDFSAIKFLKMSA